MSSKQNKFTISLAFRDVLFITFFCILITKSILFIYISYNETPTLSQIIVSFLPYCGLILVLLSVSLPIKNSTAKIAYLFLTNVLLSFLYIIHSLYFKYFSDFLSVYNLNQLSMVPSIIHIAFKMIDKELLFIVDLLFIPFLFPWLRKLDRLKLELDKQYRLSWTRSITYFLLLGLFFHSIPLSYNLLICNHFKSVFERKYLVWSMGIVTYQFYDIYSYLRTQIEQSIITPDDIALVNNWFKENHNKSHRNPLLSGKGSGHNLIVIQVESLQNFIIDKKWNDQDITPHLNRLAKTSIYFNKIFDQTWAGNTSDATFLANCSLYPARRGSVPFLYAQNSFYCLPKILKEKKYMSATMHAYKGTYWNRNIFEKALGFDLQLYQDKYIMEDQLGWGLSDKAFFSQSMEKIRNLPSPFYAYLTTLTTHVPFDDVTSKIDDFVLGDLEGKVIGNYIRSMHYVDSAIGEFIEKLSYYNLMPNSIIVIYGDHRVRFEEKDLKMIGVNNADELRKIPLIIKIPNRKQGDKIDAIGGLIDFAPTICDILGINADERYFLGKDLLMNEVGDFVIFRDASYICRDGSIDRTIAERQLLVSDLILEKDMIARVKKTIQKEELNQQFRETAKCLYAKNLFH